MFYGTKAFPNVAVLRLLREEGSAPTSRPRGELAFARAAGLSGDRARRPRQQQGRGVHAGAATEGAPVVLDAPDEAGLAAAAGVERVLVRVTLGVDADTHEAVVTGHQGSKFGLPPDGGTGARRDALERGLDVLGSTSVGSQLPDFAAQAETIRRLAAFAARVATPSAGRRGSPTSVAASGSAIARTTRCPMRWSSRAPRPRSAHEAFRPRTGKPTVWLEPGRCSWVAPE